MKKSARTENAVRIVCALFVLTMLFTTLVSCGGTTDPNSETARFKVTFLSVEGKELKTEYVEKSGSATLPVVDVPEGMYQTWSGTYTKVKEDSVVQEVLEPLIEVALDYTRLGTDNYSLAAKSKFTSSLTVIALPDTYKDLDITTVDESGFASCRKLTKVVLPAKLTTIGDNAFDFCCRLEEINLPETVTSIGDYAFRGCEAVTTVVIHPAVTSMGMGAFRNCLALETVFFEGEMEELSEALFSGCTKLVNVTFPAGLTKIGAYAFFESGLEKVIVPEGVTEIGNWAFSSCANLSEVELPAGLTSIGNWAFQNCEKLATIRYAGTQEQWNNLTKKVEWDDGMPDYTVHCADGDILPATED